VVSNEIYQTISAKLPDQMPISHGFTYMGHPTCCAAALANIAIIERERLPENSADVGADLLERLREVLGGFDSVGEIRGVGLMIGIELVADKATKRGFSKPHSACARVEAEARARTYVARWASRWSGSRFHTIDRACADHRRDLAESIA
jgi:L-2,4-diaminobutyrate transaminase